MFDHVVRLGVYQHMKANFLSCRLARLPMPSVLMVVAALCVSCEGDDVTLQGRTEMAVLPAKHVSPLATRSASAQRPTADHAIACG